ncbi:hypothetical protein GLOIN_2v1867737 [Rhizophagus irregularis DAOM 181602=DAOM 197198]|uniref:Uncharacterized protein n=1 Tax=Rhizophagus irregularis (strain DAOM 181602 / DAOM 197198 / MUCL 43194) TaxID=747089 RepID=A0A2P4QWH4_RHIID|nr:hypothetical protein GLOIN_2v1867737 [Rhizophagus irregularis DAOM 181602=DAOM 197198]POG82013.1 hypothetical protein GLOIN_2v1867737 [Rhizophagus irregularis DAOM 181602=DAOM 197198]|eukprot:XP_025188879.1 hypothetical protein GLOIN_2v1867737 [Rhizophagus irregularis DAOM 181602=DAOM 197198]
MNTKYRISKYLTSVFCGLPIDIETRNKYFLRIRQLLLDKLVVIKNRMKKQEKNRQTTTYIKFSHGRTWYLGFYIPCSFCSKFYAYVMSRNKKVCQNCRSKVIVTPTPPPQNVFKNFCQVKQVISKRVGVSYTKKVSMDGGAGAEKYKKRFKNSLKSNKNKWQFTNNGIESKVLISKHRLKRRTDILKKHYISEKEMEFLKKEAFFERKDSKIAEQSSSAGQCTTIDNIITNLQEMEISGQNNVAPWQEILGRQEPITKAEFHQELNSIRDKCLLTTYCNSVRRGRRVRDVTHDYVVNQCAIRARKIEQDKKAKSHSKKHTEVCVKDVDCNMLESNWNKWNDLAFHRGGYYWANF